MANPDKQELILLVDDNPINLQVLYRILDGRAYRLRVARDGAGALVLAEKLRPDLVLLDVMMPGIDGFEVCRRLKARPETRGCPVIFLSASDDPGDKVRGLELGAVDYIIKPFQAEEVLARVETHMKIHRLERQLIDRNKQLEADKDRILETIGEGIYGMDSDGRVSFVNRAAAKMLQWTEGEMIGRPLRNFAICSAAESGEGERAHPLYASLYDGGTHQSDACTFRRKDGSPLEVEYNTAPVYEGDKLLGAVVVFKDISKRKQAETALKQAYAELEKAHRELCVAQMRLIQAAKLESVGRLAAGVAHEVKNPLAVIQLGLDYLSAATQDGALLDAVRDMEDAVNRADSVVKGLLDFSREEGLEMQRACINDVIERSLQLVDHELIQHNIHLEKELDENIPAIDLDRNKMQQVFINLFMNAIQAMGKEGLLTVKTRLTSLGAAAVPPSMAKQRIAAGDRVVIVEVLDTGCGISESKVDKVFDPFFTTKPTGQGTGLGLSVTRNIVELHRGTIDIRNRVESGVSVQIMLRA